MRSEFLHNFIRKREGLFRLPVLISPIGQGGGHYTSAERGGYSMTRGRLYLLTIVGIAALETAAGQNAVTDWNNIAITAALAANQTTSPGSNAQAGSMLYLAYVHLAVFDAVNAIDHRYRSYGPDISASNTASK